jgi:hypothetical protein
LTEPPKSQIGDILKGDNAYACVGEDSFFDEELEVVVPRGRTLVLFDSVRFPHELLATENRERWACSGCYHEDLQPVPVAQFSS